MGDVDDARLTKIEEKIESMDRCLKGIHRDTEAIIELFKALEGGIKVIKWIGKLAAPIAAIAGAWAAIRAGVSR